MRWYRIPAALIDISSLMMRYIKAFSTESRKMKQAQESRCGFSRSSGFREKMHNIASISGALIAVRLQERNRFIEPCSHAAGNMTRVLLQDIDL